MKNKVVIVTVLLVGILISNFFNGSKLTTMFASNEEYINSADIMADYIISQYENQETRVTNNKLKSIIKYAKKLDDYGLTCNYSYNEYSSEYDVVIFREHGDSAIELKRFKLKDGVKL